MIKNAIFLSCDAGIALVLLNSKSPREGSITILKSLYEKHSPWFQPR